MKIFYSQLRNYIQNDPLSDWFNKMNQVYDHYKKDKKSSFQLELEMKNEAFEEIAKLAVKRKTGARGLRSILENILLKTMYDLPSQEGIEEVIVDAATVKGQSQPIIVHSKNKSKSEKTSAA